MLNNKKDKKTWKKKSRFFIFYFSHAFFYQKFLVHITGPIEG